METRPDMVWQMAQRIKEEYRQKGNDVEVYAITKIGINGRPLKNLIDPQIDLAAAKWDYFFHNDWILLYDDEGKRID
jgi:hypothetical protein